MSWKAEVQVKNDSKWYSNALRFPTEKAAKTYVADLMWRWRQVEATRVVECEDEINTEEEGVS